MIKDNPVSQEVDISPFSVLGQLSIHSEWETLAEYMKEGANDPAD